MKSIKGHILPVDVDGTLIIWRKAEWNDRTIAFINPHTGKSHTVVVHKPNVQLLIERASRGAIIWVWSKSGEAKATAIIKALQLQEYVSFVSDKPFAFMDDEPCSVWMGERVWLPEDSLYGQL